MGCIKPKIKKKEFINDDNSKENFQKIDNDKINIDILNINKKNECFKCPKKKQKETSNINLKQNSSAISKDKYKKYPLNNENNKIKLFGLKNLKFDCYLNSSLQVFFHLKLFNEKIKNFGSQIKSKELSNKYLELINEIDKGKSTIFDAKGIKSKLSEIESKYKYDYQHDANEFISLFLNQMKEEVKSIKNSDKKTIIQPKPNEKESFEKLENRFFKKFNSFLTELFYGRLKKEIICLNCNEVIKVNFQVYNMIELLDSSNNSLENLLIKYQKEKQISSKIKIICQHCKNDNYNYYSKTTIYNLPYYFIIYLVYPIYNFNENDYIIKSNNICEKNNNEEYELISSIAYYGNYKNGHYYAKCKDYDGTWYNFSDENYRKIENKNIIDSNDVILFFKKK